MRSSGDSSPDKNLSRMSVAILALPETLVQQIYLMGDDKKASRKLTKHQDPK